MANGELVLLNISGKAFVAALYLPWTCLFKVIIGYVPANMVGGDGELNHIVCLALEQPRLPRKPHTPNPNRLFVDSSIAT